MFSNKFFGISVITSACVSALLSGGQICLGDSSPAFYGGDLAIVGKPYSLSLPKSGASEVNWGDGSVDRSATHVYTKPGVAEVTVRAGAATSKLPKSLTLAYEPLVREARPLAYRDGAAKPGLVLAPSQASACDSLSIDCGLWLSSAKSDGVILSSQAKGAGGWTVGLASGRLYFELNGIGRTDVAAGMLSNSKLWRHLAVTYDRNGLFPGANEVSFYVDGLCLGTKSFSSDDSGAVSPKAVVATGFSGQIKNLALYGNTLYPLAILRHSQALAGESTLRVTVALPGAEPVMVTPPAIVTTVDVPLDPDPAADNGPALRKALTDATPGTHIRIVSKSGGAGGGSYYIRTSNKQPTWAALVLSGKSDVEFDGNGATLVFADNLARCLLVDNCHRVAVTNLSLDIDPTYAQVGVYVRLKSLDPQTGVVKAQLVNAHDFSPQPFVPRRASYWRWRPCNPKTLRIGTGPRVGSENYAERPSADPESGPGVIKLRLKDGPDSKLWNDLKAYQAGDNLYTINNADFSSNAVSLMNSSNVTFDHDNYYATLGMVFLSSSFDHLRVTNCKIGLPPGVTARDRPFAAGADGYHFHQTRGSIIFENNEITLTDDDPISIKDNAAVEVSRAGDDRLDVGSAPKESRFDHLVDDSQKKSASGFKIGTPVELLNPDYSETGYQARVTSVDGTTLVLDKPLPAALEKGALLMNRSSHTRDWTIRGNYLHDYYGRVMLYTDYGTVEDNRITHSLYHQGISNAYFEAVGDCGHVITHRNFFDHTTVDSSYWGPPRVVPAFQALTMTTNSFTGKGISLNDAANSLIAGNLFMATDKPILTKGCVNVNSGGNLAASSDGALRDIDSARNESASNGQR